MSDLELLAYHESGHAVAAVAVGARIASVWITSTEGACDWSGGTSTSYVHLAGACAEQRWRGDALPPLRVWSDQWSHDLANWLRAMDYDTLDCDPDAQTVFRNSVGHADKLMRDNWAAVRVLAGALAERGTLSGRDVGRLIGRERARLRQARAAGALAGRAHWPQHRLAI